MPETQTVPAPAVKSEGTLRSCLAAVIWIDWYAYHVARFKGICSAPGMAGRVAGIELVGGIGVHAGLKFREDLPSGLPIETIMPNTSWRDAGQFRLAIALWKRLSRLGPEVLLIPGYYTVPALAAAFWCKVHRRTSVMMTESTAEDHTRVWWKEFIKSTLIRTLFDWAVAGGAAHIRYLSRLGFRGDRIARFYDVVDNEFYRTKSLQLRRELPAAYGLPDNYFLYVGRLSPEKNIEALLSSWFEYRRAGGRWSLVLVGDGPSASALRQAVDASPFGPEVIFAGLRSSAELPHFYAFAQCFVLPSTREPWGLVVNEAMASRLPVIVSRRCGCAEDLVLHGRNGFVFDPSDQTELAFYLTKMEHLQTVRRTQMGLKSEELIRDYSLDAFGKEISNICRSNE